MDVVYLKVVSWHSTGGYWECQKTTTVRLIIDMGEMRPSMSSLQFIKFSASANKFGHKQSVWNNLLIK